MRKGLELIELIEQQCFQLNRRNSFGREPMVPIVPCERRRPRSGHRFRLQVSAGVKGDCVFEEAVTDCHHQSQTVIHWIRVRIVVHPYRYFS